MKCILSMFMALIAIIGLGSSAEIHNVVTIVATDSLGNNVTAADDALVVVNETTSATFFKDADVLTAKPGEIITYSYRFSNTGTSEISGLVVTDGMLGSVTMSTNTLLPGSFATGSKTYTVKESDLLTYSVNGSAPVIRNDATAKFNDITMNATAYVDLVPGVPSISIEKMTDVSVTDVGKTVTYTFLVTNTGETELTISSITDDKLGIITFGSAKLGIGGSIEIKKDHLVTLDDLQ